MGNFTWNGGTGSYDVATNWTPTGVPAPQDAASIETGSVTKAGSLTLGLAGLANGFLDVSGNGAGGTSLAIGGTLTINQISFNNQSSVQIGNNNITAATTVTAAAVNNKGNITVNGNTGLGSTVQATLDVASAAGFGTTGTLTGNVTLQGDALLEFASGQISTIATNSALTLNGPSAFLADAGSTGSNSALTGLSQVTGSLSLFQGASVTTSGGVTVGVPGSQNGFIGVDTNLGGGSSLAIGGTLTINQISFNNQSSVQVGNNNITAATTVTAAAVNSKGNITVNGNTGFGSTVQATLDVASAAGFGTAGTLTGNVDLQGDALLEFASGQISTIAANSSLTLNGPSAFLADAGSTGSNSALTGLSQVTGSLSLFQGASVTTSGGVTVGVPGSQNGFLGVDTNLGGGSSLAIGGTLTINQISFNNQSSVQVGNNNLTAATTVTAAAVNNKGNLTVNGNTGFGSTVQATLDVASAAGFGTTGTLTGNVDLQGDALLEFASGQISTIATNSALTLNGPSAFLADAASTGSNSALTGLSQVTGSLSLFQGASVTTSGGVTVGVPGSQNGFLGVDTNLGGGSSLAIGGTLTINQISFNNQSSVQVGNNNITVATIVTAAGLSNQGSLSVGGSATANASFELKGDGTSTGGIAVGSGGVFVQDAGTTLTLSSNGAGGYGSVTGAGTLTANGTIVLASDSSASASGQAPSLGVASIVDDGLLQLTGGFGKMGAVGGSITGTGGIQVGAGATLELASSVGSGNTLTFATGSDRLEVDDLSSAPGGVQQQDFNATISGFLTGDVIDLKTVTFAAGDKADLLAGNVLHITQADGTLIADLQLDKSQNFTGEFFHLSADPTTSGTDVTVDNIPCFCRGVRILTPRGEIPVEHLQVGDLITTLKRENKTITWIGFGRSLVTALNPGCRPIIVRRGALGDGVPRRDLRLTKGHSLFVEGVLIPVDLLVNGRTILWDEAAQAVEFFHVELADHDVLIADGAPAESFREDGNRILFHNADGPVHAHQAPDWYAPVVCSGPVLERAWAKLFARTGHTTPPLTEDPDLHLVADGVRIDAETVDGSLHRFRLDRSPKDLRVVSRSASPMRFGLGPDARSLGVALRRVTVKTSGQAVATPYDSELFEDGWHAPEHGLGFRWTTGNARLPAALFEDIDGRLTVSLDLACTARYPLEEELDCAFQRCA